MSWTCEAFDRWLDQGRPSLPEAEAHASGCHHCARSLAAALAIDEALALPLVAETPPDFTESVLRRARLARAFVPAPSLAWWVKVGAEPAVAAACVLTALVSWWSSDLWALGIATASRVATWGDSASQLMGTVTVFRALTSPLVILGWAPALCAASWWLFQWSQGFIARRMVPTR